VVCTREISRDFGRRQVRVDAAVVLASAAVASIAVCRCHEILIRTTTVGQGQLDRIPPQTVVGHARISRCRRAAA